MKKIMVALVTVVMVAGLAASVWANPGWSNGPRHDGRGRYERPYDRYEDHGYRFRHDERWEHRAPVVVHRVPEPIVYLPRPHVPAVGFFFPHMTIQIR